MQTKTYKIGGEVLKWYSMTTAGLEFEDVPLIAEHPFKVLEYFTVEYTF